MYLPPPLHYLRELPPHAIGSATPPLHTRPGIYIPHNPTSDILRSPAHEDGTDSRFRNVGNYNSDAGELPRKKLLTFRIRRKFKKKKYYIIMLYFEGGKA